MLSKVILPLAASSLLVAGNDVDCDYSVCDKVLTGSDCAAISTSCIGYGGIPSCDIGENEFECNDIIVADASTCTTDVQAHGLCSGFSFDHVTTCAITEGDCDITSFVSPAPTPAGGNAIHRIDCSYDSCTQVLTATDCISLESQCRAHGGSYLSCDPGDNEFECNNIPYTGTSACTDALALTQCNTYSYPGYTCTERDGDCDDPVYSTLAPTPSTSTVQTVDCDFEDCTTTLTSDDCARINAECSAYGGVAFCIPGHDEFECNNVAWSGTGSCLDDDAAELQCLTYTFTGMTCTDRSGDCTDISSSSDSEDLSDSEVVAIAFAVPIGVVGIGLGVWYCISKRAMNKPPMANANEL